MVFNLFCLSLTKFNKGFPILPPKKFSRLLKNNISLISFEVVDFPFVPVTLQ